MISMRSLIGWGRPIKKHQVSFGQGMGMTCGGSWNVRDRKDAGRYGVDCIILSGDIRYAVYAR